MFLAFFVTCDKKAFHREPLVMSQRGDIPYHNQNFIYPVDLTPFVFVFLTWPFQLYLIGTVETDRKAEGAREGRPGPQVRLKPRQATIRQTAYVRLLFPLN